MKLIPKIIFTIFTVLIISDNISAQTKPEFILKQDFLPMLDSLVLPPSNCEEAFALKVFDSSKMDYAFSTLIGEQDKRIQTIFTELTINTNVNKNNRSNSGPPPGRNGTPGGPPPGGPPPGGMPPGGFGPPEGMDDSRELFEDLEDARLAMDKMTVRTEKFKSELLQILTDVNDKLRKTLEYEDDKREVIINEFLNSALSKYNGYKRSYRQNILQLDEIVMKYNYGADIKIIPLRSKILEIQLAEVMVLMQLMNVTKELVIIGVKYHR